MRHPNRILIATCLWVMVPTLASAATLEQIDAAIDHAREYLYSHRNPEGTWEGKDGEAPPAGLTAVAVYGLLASGESPRDPKLAPAITYLQENESDQVYVLGLQLQIWSMLPQTPKVKAMLRRDGDLLMNGIATAPASAGYYGYDVRTKASCNRSTSQYGVLGLWAAARAGYAVPARFWQTVDAAWRKSQTSDGGWAYDVPGGQNATASMTAAGVATLAITQDLLSKAAADPAEDGGAARGDALTRGLTWFTEHFAEVGKSPYTLFGLQRVAVASGWRYFEGNDWYAYGAQVLVKSQKKDGSWDEHGLIPGTALGLAFLERGRMPVAVSKLRYLGPGRKPSGWNHRPRDAAHLVSWVSGRIERELHWQIVDLDERLENLLDAPVLYLSGTGELGFSADDVDKLREYVQAGGLILANSDTANKAFSESFEKLGTSIFGRPFRDLPADHLIYTGEQYRASKWKNRPRVRGLSNGVRELMLLVSEGDAGQAWQATTGEADPPGATGEALQLGSNILLYATDRRPLRLRGRSPLVKPIRTTSDDATMKVARLAVGDNWNPEPGGWRRIAAILHNRDRIGLSVDSIKMESGSSLAKYNVAHLTGTGKFNFTADQRIELLEFVDHGGVLIVDAAGGSRDFADAADSELTALFASKTNPAPLVLIPPTHPLFAAGGEAAGAIGYRAYARQFPLGDIKTPHLKGIERKGKLSVIMSREDLSAGLVGQDVDGINGYDPATATMLMRDILLYAAAKQAAR